LTLGDDNAVSASADESAKTSLTIVFI
jgi:hypothetical protein